MIELFIYTFFLVLIIACVSLRQVNEQPLKTGAFLMEKISYDNQDLRYLR